MRASEREAQLFGRYLIGKTPAHALQRRYAAALMKRRQELPPDRGELAFARRRPWALGPLDAAAGLLGGGASALRARLLLLTAILEASPNHTTHFLAPRRPSLGWVLGTLALAGLRTAAKLLVGIPLYLLVRR